MDANTDVEIKIPKILLQTSKEKPQSYVIDMLKSQLTDEWKYVHYTDMEIIEFFTKNPIEELFDSVQSVIDKFCSFQHGQHRADFFRYYFLYLNGGVFLDTDAMLYKPIEQWLKDYEFISVKSPTNSIFQGVIGVTAKHDIVRDALIHIYETPTQQADMNYCIYCEYLYDIVFNKYANMGLHSRVHLYTETIFYQYGYSCVYDDNCKIIAVHYFHTKDIPRVSNSNI